MQYIQVDLNNFVVSVKNITTMTKYLFKIICKCYILKYFVVAIKKNKSLYKYLSVLFSAHIQRLFQYAIFLIAFINLVKQLITVKNKRSK